MTKEKPSRDLNKDSPFSQRYGGAPIPVPYQQGTLSRAFRLDVMYYLKRNQRNVLQSLLNSNERISFADFFKRYTHVYLKNEFLEFRGDDYFHHKFAITDFDEWHSWGWEVHQGLSNKLIEDARSVLGIEGDNIDFNEVMDFLEFLCNGGAAFSDFRRAVEESLDKHREGYYLSGVDGEYRLHPRASAEEGDMLQANAPGIEQSDWQEVKRHLGAASQSLKAGDFDGVVRESAHAVESAVRDLTGKKNFQDAVKSLHLQSALEGSLVKLYGYASEGPRHGQPGGREQPPITEAEAMLCWSVAVSVTHYLWRTHGQKP